MRRDSGTCSTSFRRDGDRDLTGDDIVRIVGIAAALVLATAGLRGQQIGLSDGLRMAALWAFLFVAVALAFSVLGW